MDKLYPNTTQTPNVFLDDWLPILTGNEFKILSMFVRQTYGWQKDRDWMNIGQIMKRTGIKSTATISKALSGLIDKWKLIEATTEKNFKLDTAQKREQHSGRVYYRLNLKSPCAKPV